MAQILVLQSLERRDTEEGEEMNFVFPKARVRLSGKLVDG